MASRATLFSTMITAPSTIRPKSSAPRLIKLPETPSLFMPMAAISIEIGMTRAAIMAARILPSRRNSTAITSKAPSTRFFSTVAIVASTSEGRL